MKHSVVPNGVEDHVKYVVLYRPRVPEKMLLYLLYSHLHLKIPLPGDGEQYVLQIWDILLQHKNCKRLPVEDLEERRHKIIRNDHGDALVEDSLHDPGTVDFITLCTDAILATLHMLHVVHCALSFVQLAEDSHAGVFVIAPVLQQKGPEVSVHVTSKECEDRSLGRRPASKFS